MQECSEGKIDIILCKSISRFARNTVDLLEAVRYLKSIDVEVRFEKERINTLSTDGELMLSVMAEFAELERNCAEIIQSFYDKKQCFLQCFDEKNVLIISA